MKLLPIDGSPKGEQSNSRLLTRFFVERSQTGVDGLTVNALNLSHNLLTALSAPPPGSVRNNP